MPADRSTLTRGTAPGPREAEGRAQATSPANRRPPSVPRERKPALAALAVVLIVGGALVAAYLVARTGHEVAAIEITHPVSAGEQVPASALRQVEVAPDGGASYVSWANAGQVTQTFAATSIIPGTLLTSAMLARSSDLSSGKDVVGLALKDGQFPDGVQVGDHVNVYQVSSGGQSCPGSPGGLLSGDAVVLAIGQPPLAQSDSTVDVRLGLAPGQAGAVTCNAANGNVSIVQLPAQAAATGASGSGASGQAPSPPAGGTPHRGGVRHPGHGKTG